MAKMRTTTRGGRQGKAKHNDRTYLPEEERPRENRYSYVGQKNARWNLYQSRDCGRCK